MKQETSLPIPYGDCEDQGFTPVSVCQYSHLTKSVVAECGCHSVGMEPYQNESCKLHLPFAILEIILFLTKSHGFVFCNAFSQDQFSYWFQSLLLFVTCLRHFSVQREIILVRFLHAQQRHFIFLEDRMTMTRKSTLKYYKYCLKTVCSLE